MSKIHPRMISRNVLLVIGLVLGITGCVAPAHTYLADGSMRIHDIQGCAHISPFTGEQVKDIPGVVTKKVFNGFYMQDDQPDKLDCTSEGIFVFSESYLEILPGDRVSVSGIIEEFQPGTFQDHNLTITEINQPKIQTISRNNKLPNPIILSVNGRKVPDKVIEDDQMTSFDPATDGLDFYESLESMLVRVDSGIVVGSRNLYNEVVIIGTENLAQDSISKDGALIQQENDSNPERLILKLNIQNTKQVDIGASVQGSVLGIMDYSFGNYKLNVFGMVNQTGTTSVQSELVNSDDTLTLVSYNIENFSRFDDNSRFRAIATDITKSLDNPDVLILHEIMDDSGTEDNGTLSSKLTLTRLVETIEEMGGVHYVYIDFPPENDQDGGIEGGNIRSVILYREDSGLSLLNGSQDRLIPENPTRIGLEDQAFSATRKPGVVLFSFQGTTFLLVAVHLTSRSADSPLFGNIQPIEKPEEEKRIAQAEFIHQYLAKFHQENPKIPIIVAGDLNDDPWSKTLSVLKGDLLVNLNELIPPAERYSYILDGNAMQLDQILLSNSENIASTFTIPHINTLYDQTKQTSDHDPVVAEFNFENAN